MPGAFPHHDGTPAGVAGVAPAIHAGEAEHGTTRPLNNTAGEPRTVTRPLAPANPSSVYLPLLRSSVLNVPSAYALAVVRGA
jgi:hypothetical protein